MDLTCLNHLGNKIASFQFGKFHFTYLLMRKSARKSCGVSYQFLSCKPIIEFGWKLAISLCLNKQLLGTQQPAVDDGRRMPVYT